MACPRLTLLGCIALLGAVLLTTVQAQAPAIHDRDEIPITLAPPVGRLVLSPVPVRLAVPMSIRNLALGAARLTLDGRDVTPLLWIAAHAPGALTPWLDGVAVDGRVALPPGEHVLIFTVGNAHGYRHEARTRFTVISAREHRARSGWAGPREDPVDLTPPVISLTPAQNAFVTSPTPTITVAYDDGPGSGVDTSTLKVTLDEIDITSRMAVGPASATYAVPAAAGLKNGRRRITVEVRDRAKNQGKSSVTFLVFDGAKRHPWPFPPVNTAHAVGHAAHSFQQYGTAATSAYFHHGIDIMEPHGTPVHATVGGEVTNLGRYGSSYLYYEVAIRDADGFLWEYHHVDETTVPKAVKDAFLTRTPLPAGTVLGQNVNWPVRSHYGPYFHHIHLNVKDPDGRYLNGLNFLLETREALKPEIRGVWVVPQGSETALNKTGQHGVTVSGKVDIVVGAEDVVTAPYQVGAFEISYSIMELTAREGHQVSETVLWRFDDLPGGSSTSANVWDVYRRRIHHDGAWHQTQGDYSARVFHYTVTNHDGQTLSEANAWDTAARNTHGARLFPDGNYRLTVKVRDEAGNQAVSTLDVVVRNP